MLRKDSKKNYLDFIIKNGTITLSEKIKAVKHFSNPIIQLYRFRIFNSLPIIKNIVENLIKIYK